MATIPDLAAVKEYLGTDHSWSDSEIQAALDAQAGDQAKKATVPPSRETEIGLTLGAPNIVGVFTAADLGAVVTAPGVPEGAVIIGVSTDGASAVLDMDATADGAVTATLAQPWPESLRQALCRRTQVALSLQPLPLAVQVAMSDMNASQVRVGSPSQDPLVRDLERPYRKLVVG